MKIYTYERIVFHAALKEARKKVRLDPSTRSEWIRYTEMYEETLLPKRPA